jgi:hypothetical protein
MAKHNAPTDPPPAPSTSTSTTPPESTPSVPRNKGGRPRGGRAVGENWDEAEKLFIRGEIVTTKSGPAREYPSLRQIAQRTGVVLSSLHDRSKRLDWLGQRARYNDTFGEELHQAAAKRDASKAIDAVAVIDLFLEKVLEALKSGKFRVDSMADVDKAIRLRAFLLGDVESRKETRTADVTLERLQQVFESHRQRRAQLGDTGGVVVEGQLEASRAVELDDDASPASEVVDVETSGDEEGEGAS